MTVDAVKRAGTLQALALANIHQKYETEKPVQNDPFTMTFLDFVNEMEEADSLGEMDALNAKYAAFLQPFIQMILTPPEQGAPQ